MEIASGTYRWGTIVLEPATERVMSDLSDEAVVAQVRDGNTDAFGILVRKYQDRIYSTILNYVHNQEDALELSQEAFVKAYSGLRKFHGKSAFYTWLYRIAINTAIDSLRKRPAQKVESLEDDKFTEIGFEPVSVDPTVDPVKALSARERQQKLQQAIESLSTKLKTAFILHDVEGLSQEEIADILKCPVGTVKSRISRARDELRNQLAEYLEGGKSL